MRFTITSVDHAPDDLYEQTPIQGEVLKAIPGPDRPDYCLAKLDRPIRWKKDGEEKLVSHLVLAARWVGGALTPTMRSTPVNIAYVVDGSVLADDRLDLKKCAYVAIGVADGAPDAESDTPRRENLDRPLGRPVRPLLKFALVLLPFAMVGLFVARFLPQQYRDFVWASSFVDFGVCVVLATPYLMIAGGCFYAMSQLPFPKTLAVESWIYHALLLCAVGFCLRRTWISWPMNLKKQASGPPAPWWGYVLGGIAALGLFALIAYFLHFQD